MTKGKSDKEVYAQAQANLAKTVPGWEGMPGDEKMRRALIERDRLQAAG